MSFWHPIPRGQRSPGECLINHHCLAMCFRIRGIRRSLLPILMDTCSPALRFNISSGVMLSHTRRRSWSVPLLFFFSASSKEVFKAMYIREYFLVWGWKDVFVWTPSCGGGGFQDSPSAAQSSSVARTERVRKTRAVWRRPDRVMEPNHCREKGGWMDRWMNTEKGQGTERQVRTERPVRTLCSYLILHRNIFPKKCHNVTPKWGLYKRTTLLCVALGRVES